MTSEEVEKLYENNTTSLLLEYGCLSKVEAIEKAFARGAIAYANWMKDQVSEGFDEWFKENISPDYDNDSAIDGMIKDAWQAAKLSAFRDVKYTNEQYLAKDKEIDELKEKLRVRSKQIGVACLKHDLVHGLQCGRCYHHLEKENERLKHELELGVKLINDAEVSYREAVKDVEWMSKELGRCVCGTRESPIAQYEKVQEIIIRHGLE